MPGKHDMAINRRNFLRVVGGASTAAVAAVGVTLHPTKASAYDPGEEETRSRYRETDHVKAFYRVNRYPTSEK